MDNDAASPAWMPDSPADDAPSVQPEPAIQRDYHGNSGYEATSEFTSEATSEAPQPHEQESAADMMMITAIIQPFKLDVVTLALERIPGFGGMTISECRGFGRRKVSTEAAAADGRGGTPEVSRHGSAEVGLTDFTQKMKLEIAVAGRARADAVISAISEAAHTGRPGDGKIFVWPIITVVRVRTLDLDAAAL